MNDVEIFAKTIPLGDGCEIASCDESGLIAISKKAGKATHPNPDGGKSAPMVRAPYNFKGEYYSWEGADGEANRLWLINRLDSPTSGIVLAAANQEAAAAAKRAFLERKGSKKYVALCVCRAPVRAGTWRDTLYERKLVGYVRNSFVRVADSSIKKAETKFFVEGFDKNNYGVCLVRLEPLTGITHQLRVQCAKHGMPILGDATYGNFAANKKIRSMSKINRLFLHCACTELEAEISGKKVVFSAAAKLPESFEAIMQKQKI